MSVPQTRDQAPQIARVAGPAQSTASAGSPAGPGLTGKDILRIIRKRLWLIILCFGASVVLAIVGTFLWQLYAPWYTASALLEVVPPKPTELTPSIREPSEDVISRIAQSHINSVTSDTVLDQAIRQNEDLRRTRWYQENQTDAIQALSEDISAGHIAGTQLIRISMTGTSRRELPVIVNAVAEVTAEESRERLRAAYQVDLRPLETELASLEDRLDQVRERMRTARPEDIPNIDNQRNVLSMRIQSLSQQMTQLELAKAQAEAAFQAAQQRLEDGTLDESPTIQQGLDMDPILRSLRNAEVNLTSEYQSASGKLGPQHRKVQDLEARLSTLREEIDRREAQLTEDLVASVMGEYEANINAVTQQLLEVGSKYNEANTRLRELQANLVELQQAAAEEQRILGRMQTIQRRRMDLQLLSRNERGTVSMFQQATIPREPSMPQWALMVPLGCVLGLVFGFGLAFLLEFIDTSIKGPSDVSRRMDLPLLGMVPHVDDVDEEFEDLRMAFAEHPNSLVGEAFRQIRTTLMFSGPLAQRRSVLVTSALPEDGRSTISLNLAASVARGGKRVLVVDSNFRQPVVRSLFPQCSAEGLSNALVDQGDWREMVCQVEPNLEVMSSGPLPPNPAELLGSDAMRNLVSEMTAEYDQVIFDGAPCLVVTDSVVLSTTVDGVILTVRAGVNTYGIVQRMRDTLSRVGAHILGAVLNGVRVTAGGYLRKNYDTFYDYQYGQARLPGREESSEQLQHQA